MTTATGPPAILWRRAEGSLSDKQQYLAWHSHKIHY
jgi:hypothetical protein